MHARMRTAHTYSTHASDHAEHAKQKQRDKVETRYTTMRDQDVLLKPDVDLHGDKFRLKRSHTYLPFRHTPFLALDHRTGPMH